MYKFINVYVYNLNINSLSCDYNCNDNISKGRCQDVEKSAHWRDQEWVSVERPRMGLSGETKNGCQWRDQEWVSVERPKMGHYGETMNGSQWRDQEWVSVARP